MTLQLRALHSRFGRRLLLLFVGCALVPIGVVALVSYRHVSRHLLSQSETRLRQANIALGSAVFERLLALDATLNSIPPQAIHAIRTGRRPGGERRPARPPEPVSPRRPTLVPSPSATTPKEREADRALVAGVGLLAKRRFVALEFVGDDHSRVAVFGRLDVLPPVSRADSAELAVGLPLITTQHGDGRPTRIYIVRRFERRGVRGHLVGEISPEFLWGTLDQSMPSAATVMMVVDDSAHVLFRSTPAAQALEDDLIPRPALEAGDSTAADAPLVVVSRPLVLDEVFAAPAWTLVLGQPRDEVLGPMVPFTRTFLLVMLVSATAVLLLSVHQIRRSLLPMHALQEGAGRIAQRDFSSRVAIRSNDEFEELGSSFNAMAAQIDRQFQALATAAEIDRAVLSATDA
ncbi:MAG TPA: HAMP domain-containing protein, partial [Gemmatimonadales bacterium]|nr:HAMP domain-containing protein [Gemmatimonadales bacterium]